MSTDPIADMLTRIRNAQLIGKTEVVLPHSKIKQAIAELMRDKGFLADVAVSQNGSFTILSLTLKDNTTAIRSIRRISKPGRRIYAKRDQIPYVLNGRGMMIVSTSRG